VNGTVLPDLLRVDVVALYTRTPGGEGGVLVVRVFSSYPGHALVAGAVLPFFLTVKVVVC
jgi:hypothetical protein